MFKRIFDDKHTTTSHGGITDVFVFLAGTDHDALLFGLSNHGGEHGLGRVFAGKTGLAATRTIVNHDGGLGHGGQVRKLEEEDESRREKKCGRMMARYAVATRVEVATTA